MSVLHSQNIVISCSLIFFTIINLNRGTTETNMSQKDFAGKLYIFKYNLLNKILIIEKHETLRIRKTKVPQSHFFHCLIIYNV